MTDTEKLNSRIYYLDFLRVAAIIAVVFAHTARKNFMIVEPCSFDWIVFNCYFGITRWAVPVLTMVSGTLFLDERKKLSISRLHSKNIRRILIALALWSAIYSAAHTLFQGEGITDFIAGFFESNYHLWFLFMIVGLYLVTPLLRMITVSETMIKYFLGLAFIFSFAIPSILIGLSAVDHFIGDGTGNALETVGQTVVDNISVYLPVGFTAYFVGGYYLNKIEIPPKAEYCIYACGIIGCIIAISITAAATSVLDAHYEFYGNYKICVAMEGVAAFTFGKCKVSKWIKNNRKHDRLLAMSKWSFGIYLVHVLFLEAFSKFVFETTAFNPILTVPVTAAVVLAASVVFSALANRIPVVNRYLV